MPSELKEEKFDSNERRRRGNKINLGKWTKREGGKLVLPYIQRFCYSILSKIHQFICASFTKYFPSACDALCDDTEFKWTSTILENSAILINYICTTVCTIILTLLGSRFLQWSC
jgi:hypothetical protein